MPSLFEQVVDCCGLAPAFARKIITEACERSNATTDAMTPADLIRTLPYIHQALSVFLDAQEVTQKTTAMRRLVRSSWPDIPEVPPPSTEADSQNYLEDPNTKSTS